MKTTLLSLLILCLFILPLTSCAQVRQTEAPVSTGLSILAEQSPMAKAGLCGSPVSFSEKDFGRAMNLASIESVTVTRVPSPEEGELRLGNVVVNNAQTISASALSDLTYVSAKGGVRYSSFLFTVNDSPVEMRCEVFLLNAVNHAPTALEASDAALSVSTSANKTLTGELPSYDPDGDVTTVEIVSYPESGILILTDAQKGTYTYTPYPDRTGRDSFTYVVRDPYGNYSAATTVSLQIVKS